MVQVEMVFHHNYLYSITNIHPRYIAIILWSKDSFVTFNRIYKMPDGKPENVFGFDGAYKDPEFAAKVFIKTLFGRKANLCSGD